MCASRERPRSRVTEKSLVRLSWVKWHFSKTFRGSCGWFWFSLKSLCVLCWAVGCFRWLFACFWWFLVGHRLHSDSSLRGLPNCGAGRYHVFLVQFCFSEDGFHVVKHTGMPSLRRCLALKDVDLLFAMQTRCLQRCARGSHRPQAWFHLCSTSLHLPSYSIWEKLTP